MKKFLSLAAASVMAITLVGCGSSSDADLKISGLDGGFGTKGWEKVVAEFEKQEGVKVELTLEKNIADTLKPVIQSGKDVPDLIYLSIGAEGGLTDTMVSEKQILEIEDVLDIKVPGEEATVKEKIIPGFADALNLRPYEDGKLYLAPINYSPCGLFYNEGLFEAKGWTVPTTWDEMWALGDKAKAEGIALFTYPTTGYFDAFFSALLNETAGPEVYEKLMHYDAAAWETPEVKAAFEIVAKLATYTEANTVANATADKGFTKNQQLILDNKALFCPNGTWLPGEMEDAPRADGFKWGFTALPKVTADGDAYSSTFTEQMYIPKDAKNVDLAKKFMAFCYSDKAAEIFYKDGKGAVMPSINASNNIADDDANKLYYSVYDNGAKASVVGFAAAEAVEGVDLTSASGVLYGTVNSVVSGDKSLDDWYNAVISAVKQYSKQFTK